MGRPNPLVFFATQFLLLPWILPWMLMQNLDQATGVPVNASSRHNCCASPASTVHWSAHHSRRYHCGGLVVINWLLGFRARYLLTAPPFLGAPINPRQTLAALSGLGGTPAMGRPNPLVFFATQPWMKTVAPDMDEKLRVAAQLQAESRTRKAAAARRRRQQADPEVKTREVQQNGNAYNRLAKRIRS
ncbi:hypothetical protein HPB52_024647 [Rhipicephalus sanguineus]|uniref:Uncharacterized protein n=1 Tax=Rhipicephalus sanguineus TaxID=34632 RepID=A0A9D4TE27_RHISA|nr:hypothetical protein HPB52_024647 [Rhipicephalus sanguineus]